MRSNYFVSKIFVISRLIMKIHENIVSQRFGAIRYFLPSILVQDNIKICNWYFVE